MRKVNCLLRLFIAREEMDLGRGPNSGPQTQPGVGFRSGRLCVQVARGKCFGGVQELGKACFLVDSSRYFVQVDKRSVWTFENDEGGTRGGGSWVNVGFH